VANDIIPFNEKGINRGRTPITFNLFNTNLKYKSNTITLSYSCHVYIFLFHHNKDMFVLWCCTLYVRGFGFLFLSWFLCFVFWIRFRLKPILLSSIFVAFMPMTKGRREQMWKHVIKLIMIQWKCDSNTKQEWRLIIKLKMLEFCFYHVDCDLWLSIFCHEFFLFGHAHIFFTFIVACICLKGGRQQVMVTSLCMYYMEQNNWKN
jgi:hypothetical protein